MAGKKWTKEEEEYLLKNYKKANRVLAKELNDELMIGMSVPTIRKYIKQLVEKGYLIQRRNPKYKWDKTMQYRVDLYKVQLDLGKMGYVLEGFKLLPNIKIVEEIELTENENVESNENKEAPTFAEVEAEDFKNLIDDNIILQKDKEYSSNEKEIKEKNVNIEKEVDIRELAYNLCLKEVPNFDDFDDNRKEFFINIKVARLLRE